MEVAAENGDFPSRWFQCGECSLEEVQKIIIFCRGGSENRNFLSRWFRKLHFSLEVVLKIFFFSRSRTQNVFLNDFALRIQILRSQELILSSFFLKRYLSYDH